MPVFIQDTPNFYDRFLEIQKARNALSKQELENKYYAPNIQSEIDNRNALTKGQNIHNQYLPDEYRLANIAAQLKNQYYAPNIQSQIALRKAQAAQAGAETGKTNYMLQHPGLMGSDDAKTLQMMMDLGLINKNSMNQTPAQNALHNVGQTQQQAQPQNHASGLPSTNAVAGLPSQNIGQPPSNAMQTIPAVTSTAHVFDPTAPFRTGNQLVDAMLNRKYAETAYKNQMTKGFNWVHLPVETKNQLVAQGYGMGIDPLKMADYVNRGMTLPQIAQAEGLDPDNLPSPIYPPTTATKTRVQQVQQVGQELDYLSSATTPIIKQYANTFAGVSPARISDMLSNDPAAQKRFGEYIGALSVQTGLATGRVLLEGGKSGLEVMKMVKDSSMKGIDDNSPIKMSGIAYDAAQKKINEILQRGAKIRTTTGMNPMSEIGKSHRKSSQKDVKDMTDDELRKIVNG